MAGRRYQTVLSNERFHLRKAIGGKPVAGGGWIAYRLVDRSTGKALMSLNCSSPSISGDPAVIGNVKSLKPGNIFFMRDMIRLIRQDLRVGGGRLDIVSNNPTPEMRRFYRKRLGARRRDGYYRFPQKL